MEKELAYVCLYELDGIRYIYTRLHAIPTLFLENDYKLLSADKNRETNIDESEVNGIQKKS